MSRRHEINTCSADVAFFCDDNRSVDYALSVTQVFSVAIGALETTDESGGLWQPTGNRATESTNYVWRKWSFTASGKPLDTIRKTEPYWDSTYGRLRQVSYVFALF